MNRLSFCVVISRRIVLRPREMSQEPNIRDGLEEEKRAPAALLPDELQCVFLASCAREKKGDDAVVESPMCIEFAVFDKLNGIQEMLVELPKRFGATVNLNAWNTNRQRRLVRMFANEQMRCPIKTKLRVLQLDEKGIFGFARPLRHVGVLHQLGKFK